MLFSLSFGSEDFLLTSSFTHGLFRNVLFSKYLGFFQKYFCYWCLISLCHTTYFICLESFQMYWVQFYHTEFTLSWYLFQIHWEECISAVGGDVKQARLVDNVVQVFYILSDFSLLTLSGSEKRILKSPTILWICLFLLFTLSVFALCTLNICYNNLGLLFFFLWIDPVWFWNDFLCPSKILCSGWNPLVYFLSHCFFVLFFFSSQAFVGYWNIFYGLISFNSTR